MKKLNRRPCLLISVHFLTLGFMIEGMIYYITKKNLKDRIKFLNRLKLDNFHVGKLDPFVMNERKFTFNRVRHCILILNSYLRYSLSISCLGLEEVWKSMTVLRYCTLVNSKIQGVFLETVSRLNSMFKAVNRLQLF